MRYTLIILLDGDKVGTYRQVDFEDLEYLTELSGASLAFFRQLLESAGQAVDVERTSHGVRVVVAHEEI